QCVPGGQLFAAALDSESCEQSGPPPSGGYISCDGIVFFQPGGAFSDPNPLHARVPAPLPYPFVASPDRPLPPIRLAGTIVTSLAFVGPGMRIGGFSTALTTNIPVQYALIAGTADGALVYLDIGIGNADGGTGPLASGAYSCPPAFFAPRILDENDYLPSPPLPAISQVAGGLADGGALPTFETSPDAPLTADGGPVPAADRLGQPFASNGASPISCYSIAVGSDICFTSGFVQHGAANDETYTVVYQGAIGSLSGEPGSVSGASLTSQAGIDFTTYLPEAKADAGVVLEEAGNLGVDIVTSGGAACGDYGISQVTASGLTLTELAGGSPLSCAQGTGTFTVFARAKPYTVTGSESGFVGVWPDDGSLHLVETGRWQYPADLIGMAHSAQELTDLVFGPVPSAPAAGSSLTPPRPEDYDSLDSAFGLALLGPLGPPLESASPLDGGPGSAANRPSGVTPSRGAQITFSVSSGVLPLTVNPADNSALIESMVSYLDANKARHLYASYWGGSALIELNPEEAVYTALNETH
ncbi:MAG: hypothetical protein ACYCWW_16820, partial [Deltaproteobacteria bacterium]